MKTNIIQIVIAILFIHTFSSCNTDDPKPENPVSANPGEIITTVKFMIEDSLGNPVTASWTDADGDGPGQPVIDTLVLREGVWTGSLLLLDESKFPTDTISYEVEEESDVHQFFYTVSGNTSSRLTIERTDTDINNNPLGLQFRMRVNNGAELTGALKVVLKHYDGIPKSSDPLVGETDAEAVFPLKLQ